MLPGYTNLQIRLIDSDASYIGNHSLTPMSGTLVATVIYQKLERVEGIEPSHQPWQGYRLPLHHTRIKEQKW